MLVWHVFRLCYWIAGLLPLARVDDLSVGLGLIGPHGSDKALLALTEDLMAAHSAAGAR